MLSLLQEENSANAVKPARDGQPVARTQNAIDKSIGVLLRGGSRNWERGGAQVRVWQGVGQSWMRSRPGEGAGGGHPSRPARGSGGAL